MERQIKYSPYRLCSAVFALCLSVRFIEYFLIETDRTAIGENFIHKVFGIILLAAVLKITGLGWGHIGFKADGAAVGILKGLLLGSVCFAMAYALELAVSALKGTPARLELYVSGFSLTGPQTKSTGLVPLTLCVLFNIVNVWMEEGVFRGLFIRTLLEAGGFMRANIIAAALFGVWHVAMPVRSCVYGEMTVPETVLMSAGYILLAGIMGIKWGLLYRMTGSLWVGLGDHLLNNTVATNMLHVVSSGGADELQIIRIFAAQLISFVIVLALYRPKASHKNNIQEETHE